MNDVIAEIAAERRRQIEAEGWAPEHDDEHGDGSLANAAACYAATETVFFGVDRAGPAYQTFISYEPAWPWADRWWKPKDRRRDLIRAAALIVAEIERLDRAAAEAACPICAVAFKPGDTCATDIELDTCHAACLAGSPVVNLETGEPTSGAAETFPFGDADTADAMRERS